MPLILFICLFWAPIVLAAGGDANDLSSPPAFMQLINQQALGLTITSPTLPVVNGTYALDPQAQAYLAGIYAGAANGHLPGGGPTFNYPDMAATPHSFDAPHFISFGNAVSDYLYAVNAAIKAAAGGTPTFPSNSVSIP